MIEASITTYDGKIIDFNKGDGGSVEFNFDRIWMYLKKLDKIEPSLLDFYHVHPPGFKGCSLTDINCMKGFNMAFGFDIDFSIVSFSNYDLYDTTHVLLSFAYKGDMFYGVPPKPIGQGELLFLKYLSYGELK